MNCTKRLSFNEIDKYRNVMDSNLSSEYYAAYLLGQTHFNVGLGLIEKWEKELSDYKKKERALIETSDNNNRGIAFEKSGNLAKAIEIYETNLIIGYTALHSYERLMILYRKEKRYEDEIRVIEKAINDFPIKSHSKYIDKWKSRLEKVKKLI